MLLLLYAAFVTLAFLCLITLDARGYLRGAFKDGATGRKAGYRPKTLVIIPCKGRDIGLAENLESIGRQEYHGYDIVAVVDSTVDEALPAIKKAGISFVVAREVSRAASGKVNAILTAIERHGKYEVYVIADSDILVDRKWLGTLIAPLADGRVGLSTMYPYFKPVGGFWSKVKMVWGFVGEGLLENEKSRFGWGGSLAFRRDILQNFRALAMNSRYSVSDDICITKAVASMGLSMAYSNSSRPIVRTDDNFRTFYEWANRQTALSLLGYRRNLLYYGIAFYAAEILVFLSGIALAVTVSPLFVVFLSHTAISIEKTYRKAGLSDPAISLIEMMSPFIYLSNLLLASRMRSIRWRGRSYRLPVSRAP